MRRSILVAVLALSVGACEDKRTIPPNRIGQVTDTRTKTFGPNDPRPFPPSWKSDHPPLRSFSVVVAEKHEKGFIVQGLSGRKYLLLPTPRLTERPPDELDLINYAQIKVKDKLNVRVSWKLPYVPVYLCEGVVLHGVRHPGNGELILPKWAENLPD